MRQLERFAHHLVEVEQLKLCLALPEQGAKPPDDLAGARVLLRDIVEDLAHFLHVDGPLVEQALRRLGVGENRRQRLAELVRERSGELAEDRHSSQVRELALAFLHLAFCAPLVGEISDDRDEARLAGHLRGLCADDDLAQLPGLAAQRHLQVAHVALRDHDLLEGVAFLGGRKRAQIPQGAAYRRLAVVAEERLPSIVDVDDAAVRPTRDHHAVRAGAEGLGEALLGAAQRRLRAFALLDHGREEQQRDRHDDQKQLDGKRAFRG